MKTLILTGSDEEMLDVLDLTLPSKHAYCKKHNYDILSMRSFSPKPKYYFNSLPKHIGLLRVLMAFKQLMFYDNVMWIDADSIITNMDYKIEEFISGDECFIASYDWMSCNSFSTGNFIVRKTGKTEELFNMFIQRSPYWLNHILTEQGLFNELYRESAYNREMFNILPHKFLNSVPDFIVETQTWRNDNNRSGVIAPWSPDCFLAHLTGTSNQERIEILTSNKLKLKI
jgi:hypothetical protein